MNTKLVLFIIAAIVVGVLGYLTWKYLQCKKIEGTSCSDLSVQKPSTTGTSPVVIKKNKCNFFTGIKCVSLSPIEVVEEATGGRG